jgi:hypothetical protein
MAMIFLRIVNTRHLSFRLRRWLRDLHAVWGCFKDFTNAGPHSPAHLKHAADRRTVLITSLKPPRR